MLEHTAMLRGTVERLQVRGASLTGNALGDSDERELIVYLPPGYARTQRRYAVVMVLAGFAATNTSLLNFKPWEPNLIERYERLLAEGCGEVILVLPDCFTRLGGSQYLDSPATGNYQTYLAEDVLTIVDSRYRTLAKREARAIVGKSSGGFGALRMGMDRPECFAVVGSHAGDCGFELSIRPRFGEVAPIYERHGGADGFLRFVEARGGPRSQGEFHALELLALAYAYAPVAGGTAGAARDDVSVPVQSGGGRDQLAAPPPIEPPQVGELPFNPHTAMVVPERWERWLAHDPVVRAEDGHHGLHTAQLVFLDAGKSDEYGLQFGARMLAEHLTRSGVAVHHEEFDGGHMGTAYRYDVSLPRVVAALEHDPMVSVDLAPPTGQAPPSPGDGPGSDTTSPHAQDARTMREPL